MNEPALDIATFDLGVASRFVAATGLVIDQMSGTRVSGHIDLGADHYTPWGIVHGGVYTSAIESAASIGASAAVADEGRYAVGMHNATDLLKASRGGRADVIAEPVHQGHNQQIWVVTVTDERQRQLARGQVRLQNVTNDRDY